MYIRKRLVSKRDVSLYSKWMNYLWTGQRIVTDCSYTFLQTTGKMRESISRTGSLFILHSAFCFRFMLTWLEVERWRSRGVNNRINKESWWKTQIFPMWASGLSSNVLRVIESCLFMYMVSTHLLNYYGRLLESLPQMALLPLFSVSSIANFLTATTRTSRSSADISVSASTLLPRALVHYNNKPTGYAMFHLCYVTSIVSEWNIWLVCFNNMNSMPVLWDFCFFTCRVLF